MFKYLLSAWNVNEWINLCRILLRTYGYSREIVVASKEKEKAYLHVIETLEMQVAELQAENLKLNGMKLN